LGTFRQAPTFTLLKYIPVILLLTGMVGQTFSKCFLLLEYQWNKNYIATHLCENRDKPGLKCEGTCYLCKRLRKEDKKDRQDPDRKAENKWEIVSLQPRSLISHPLRRVAPSQYPFFQENIFDSFPASFFHPPQC
jgi:hypothetical protein